VNAYLIIGEPGTRKSSLLRSLTGLLQPEATGISSCWTARRSGSMPGFRPCRNRRRTPGISSPRSQGGTAPTSSSACCRTRTHSFRFPIRMPRPISTPSSRPAGISSVPRWSASIRSVRPFRTSLISPGPSPSRSISLPRISGPTSSGTDAAITSGISMRYLAVVHIPVEDSFPGCSRDDRPADRTSTSPEYRYRPLRLNRHQKDKPMKSGRR